MEARYGLLNVIGMIRFEEKFSCELQVDRNFAQTHCDTGVGLQHGVS